MPVEPFKMSGQQGSQDKQGVVEWTVPNYVETLTEVFSEGKEAPMKGLKETSRDWSDIEGAGVQVEVKYEGFVTEDEEEDPEKAEPVFEWDSSFKEERIEAHPLFPDIEKFYNGKYDEEENVTRFPKFMGGQAGQIKGLGGNKNKKKNPMFGVETFMSLSVNFKKTYLRKKIPPEIFQNIGTIAKSLPDGYPTPIGRDWLVMPPKISEKGEIYQITEELLLSMPGGWPREVYKLIII